LVSNNLFNKLRIIIENCYILFSVKLDENMGSLLLEIQ